MSLPDIPLRSCSTCGMITQDRCSKGHSFCSRCQEELGACETCLEEDADAVRGIRP